ncbi:3-methyl-2-oxobutanoate hydroxymethyltransferase [Campylobacter helveticus]|uniref:3-methyl-2-oxobutanoate hydroxymethyltransferase n=1 Tax=Campylobacter helveticus TaxID=28898 RepID=A0AAX2UGR0_9BACT|nr:3-methyl-2-oxobutanoate hydroxymethyltransferase [Campylobacter helveticus]ARE80404.1 3-methyl-2-oxobutanoate hydroxymethyltransferase [Campylobacter helveticus]MCR2039628.1 3-methyl-2-oxobutanoate hydroxymethyltransferase [Campylobacter helveticus]MCR2054282.1 3-methyl-2-oxobutanoate hydroxymethyltransferase [Campylobacter helveticus]MCR2056829.1 3-methyl-2-oxobutanoate hydroxymethyltransferase [Campylobacter helveticus]MCR2059809.1 3-methyl-2-oxobutanoate hydroxymethyltransferase [Campylo
MRKSIVDFKKQKETQDKITMVAAYDYPSAKALDEAGVDIILVGDSVAMVLLGHEDTLSVSVEEMLIFNKAVSRASQNAFVLADMPFMSYQSSTYDALQNAAKFIKIGRANGVKLEGGREFSECIKALSRASIPVVAHIGLTPQAINAMGGYKVQGKSKEAAQKLIDDAKAVEDAGASMVLMECVPSKLAKKITEILQVPTIGIGAGKHCDGQVLVYHDFLGLHQGFKPKFVRKFADLNPNEGIKAYINAVKSGEFPSDAHSFSLENDEWIEQLY